MEPPPRVRGRGTVVFGRERDDRDRDRDDRDGDRERRDRDREHVGERERDGRSRERLSRERSLEWRHDRGPERAPRGRWENGGRDEDPYARTTARVSRAYERERERGSGGSGGGGGAATGTVERPAVTAPIHAAAAAEYEWKSRAGGVAVFVRKDAAAAGGTGR